MSLLEPAASGSVGPLGLSGLGFDDVDDDPEILRAALDFIEACEASDASDELEPFDGFSDGGFSSDDIPAPSASASPCAANDTAAASVPETVAAKPRTGTRNRRKEEIAELRKLVGELESQLAGTKRKLQWPEALELVRDDLPLASVTTDAVWSHIARRQQQQRQQAELENMRLRNMVTQQLSVARDLTHVAKRRALVMDTIGGGGSDAYESILTAADRETMAKVAVGEANESPLLVKIYPSRPTGVRVGGKSLTATDSLSRLLDGLSLDQPTSSKDTKDAESERVWTPSATWQSPKTLLRGLLTPHQSEPLNLRLLRLAKPQRGPLDDDRDAVKAGGDAMQDMVSLGTSISSRALQRASHRITTCL